MKKKIAFIHLFFIVIALGMKVYQLTGPNLIWNMFLALVSLDFILLAYVSKSKLLKGLFTILWFFFYPNTFYMVTDIIHMHFASTVLYDRHSMILFMLYVPSIFFGALSGIEGVRVLLKIIPIPNTWLRGIFYSFLSFVASLAIHIGRYARLNSWDIFTRPRLVIDEILAVLTWDAFVFVVGFTCIQVMCLVFMDDGGYKKR